MKFEIVENLIGDGGGWIVRRDGIEVSRHRDQEQALADIAARLRCEPANAELSYSLAMRYRARG